MSKVNHRIRWMGTCGLSPANQEGGDTHPGEPKAHVPPAPGPQTSPTAASPPPARTLMRDGGLWGARPLLHSPGGSGTGSGRSPRQLGPLWLPPQVSSSYAELPGPCTPAGKVNRRCQKRKGRALSSAGRGPAASFPFPGSLPRLEEGTQVWVPSTPLPSAHADWATSYH